MLSKNSVQKMYDINWDLKWTIHLTPLIMVINTSITYSFIKSAYQLKVFEAHIPPENVLGLGTQCEQKGDKQHEPNPYVSNVNHIPPACVEARVGHTTGKVTQNMHFGARVRSARLFRY